MERNSHFITYTYSKNFHGREPGYNVDHGEGIGYDLELEGILYTTSLEEAEHDIAEYAKNYTNKEKPLFGFHTLERPGSAFLITTKEGTTEQLSERWYSPDGTPWEKNEVSTFSGDPEEKRAIKGWANPHFKAGDIVEFFTPKNQYVGIGIVRTDAIPAEIANIEVREKDGTRCGYDRDTVQILTPNLNEEGSFVFGFSHKYSVARVNPVNVFKPSLPLTKRDEHLLRFVEEIENKRCELMKQLNKDDEEERLQKKTERIRETFRNAASNYIGDGFD